ncbi:MAG: GAF domain-containing protein, partial [Polyangiaceae bacterium]
CAFTESAWRFVAGEPLPDVEHNIESQRDIVDRVDGARSIQRRLRQAVENLRNPAGDSPPHVFAGEHFDEASPAAHEASSQDKTSVCIHHVLRLYLSYLFGEYDEAVTHAVEAERRIDSIVSMPLVPFLRLYAALARIAAARAKGREMSITDSLRVRRTHAAFRKWAAFGPANYAHRLALLEAEMERGSGRAVRGTTLLRLYEQAISAAQSAGQLADKALALELAADACAASGDTSVATALFDRSIAVYRRWGALAKANALLRSRAHLGLTAPPSTRVGAAPSDIAAGASLDLVSVVKASGAIAEEIVMDRLLARLVEILAENAGAERGALLFAGEYDLTLEAERSADGTVTVRRATPVSSAKCVCEEIVRYVARTHDHVVLDDAGADGRFRGRPYIQENAVRSVLCTPIMHRGKLIGVLYFENNLVARAFTAERRQLLDLLSAQAAVSLQNARVYETLEERVSARTKELRRSNDELAATLSRLRDAQQQLITQEKLASLGALTSGIAHEIKNPLNFVNNFSELSLELLDELGESLVPGADLEAPEIADTLSDLKLNIGKVREHGLRADGIVRSMLDHARVAVSELQDTDLNSLVSEYAKLAHYDMRSRGQTIDVLLDTRFCPRASPRAGRPPGAGPRHPQPRPQRRLRRRRQARKARPRLHPHHHPHHPRPPRQRRAHHPRQRPRHPPRHPRQGLRPLLHHQARRRGHRPRPLDQPRHRRPAPRRHPPLRLRPRRIHRVHRLLPVAAPATDPHFGAHETPFSRRSAAARRRQRAYWRSARSSMAPTKRSRLGA